MERLQIIDQNHIFSSCQIECFLIGISCLTTFNMEKVRTYRNLCANTAIAGRISSEYSRYTE